MVTALLESKLNLQTSNSQTRSKSHLDDTSSPLCTSHGVPSFLLLRLPEGHRWRAVCDQAYFGSLLQVPESQDSSAGFGVSLYPFLDDPSIVGVVGVGHGSLAQSYPSTALFNAGWDSPQDVNGPQKHTKGCALSKHNAQNTQTHTNPIFVGRILKSEKDMLPNSNRRCFGAKSHTKVWSSSFC